MLLLSLWLLNRPAAASREEDKGRSSADDVRGFALFAPTRFFLQEQKVRYQTEDERSDIFLELIESDLVLNSGPMNAQYFFRPSLISHVLTRRTLIRACNEPHFERIEKRLPPVEKEQLSTERIARLTDRDYNLYEDTEPPRQNQLEYANKFFEPSKHSPIHIWASSLFRMIPESEIPEVAFVGRSNTGKSTLINSLVGKHVCNTSRKLGRTQEFHAYGVGGQKGGDSKFALIDLPGYGKGSKDDWGTEILKYFQGRKQYVDNISFSESVTDPFFSYRLRRVIVLIDPKHGFKQSDADILTILRENAVPHQLVLTKIDQLLVMGGMKKSRGFRPSRLAEYREKRERLLTKIEKMVPPGPGMLQDFLATSSKISRADLQLKLGLDPLRWSLLRATGFDSGAPAEEPGRVSSGDSRGAERFVLRHTHLPPPPP
jgi:GTP-binding protein